MQAMLAGVLAGQQQKIDSSGPNSEHFVKMFSLLDLGSFLQVLRIVGK
jgi:hypothetical protein